MAFEDKLANPVALREYGVGTAELGNSAKKLVDKAVERNLTPHAMTFDLLEEVQGELEWQLILWTD